MPAAIFTKRHQQSQAKASRQKWYFGCRRYEANGKPLEFFKADTWICFGRQFSKTCASIAALSAFYFEMKNLIKAKMAVS